MSFWTLLLSFAPWVTFKIMVHLPFAEPLLMVKISLSAAVLICAWQAVHDKTRGVIFWGTIAFFSFSFVDVVILSNTWVIFHLGLLSQLQLAGLTFGSMIVMQPFTIAYAKQRVAKENWQNPAFLLKNQIITGVWGVAFAVGVATAIMRLYNVPVSGILFECIDDVSMLGAMIFTTIYTKRKKTPDTAEAV